MLNLGLDLIECFTLHYSSCPKRGTQPCKAPIITDSQQLSALSKTGHTHSFYQYSYVLAAHGTQVQIGTNVFPATPGSIYMFKPDVPHSLIMGERYEAIIYEIKFSASAPDLCRLLQDIPPIIADANGSIFKIVRMLTAEFNQRMYQDAMSHVKLYELLLTLNRMAQAAPSLESLKPYEMEHSRFAPLITYINQNFSKKITIHDMADIMHMANGYFSRQFKRQFDVTPMNYLLTVRISRSLNLIEYTDLSIAKVAEAVGFQNQNSFIKAFKGLYSMTPGEYRRKIRQIIQNKYTEPAKSGQ